MRMCWCVSVKLCALVYAEGFQFRSTILAETTDTLSVDVFCKRFAVISQQFCLQ